jgi:predicted RNase H-like HicB family nuclease
MEKKSKTKPKYKYQIMIHWSPEDSVYLAIAPELEDCITHGETQKKA